MLVIGQHLPSDTSRRISSFFVRVIEVYEFLDLSGREVVMQVAYSGATSLGVHESLFCCFSSLSPMLTSAVILSVLAFIQHGFKYATKVLYRSMLFNRQQLRARCAHAPRASALSGKEVVNSAALAYHQPTQCCNVKEWPDLEGGVKPRRDETPYSLCCLVH